MRPYKRLNSKNFSREASKLKQPLVLETLFYRFFSVGSKYFSLLAISGKILKEHQFAFIQLDFNNFMLITSLSNYIYSILCLILTTDS